MELKNVVINFVTINMSFHKAIGYASAKVFLNWNPSIQRRNRNLDIFYSILWWDAVSQQPSQVGLHIQILYKYTQPAYVPAPFRRIKSTYKNDHQKHFTHVNSRLCVFCFSCDNVFYHKQIKVS